MLCLLSLFMWPLDTMCVIYISQKLLEYGTRVFLIISVLKPEFSNKQSWPLEHNTGTKQQTSDWRHQGRANRFGRIAGKWSFEIFSGMWCQSCSYRKPLALFVGGEGAVKGMSQFICASIVLQKQLYLINLQQSGALRECITFCV